MTNVRLDDLNQNDSVILYIQIVQKGHNIILGKQEVLYHFRYINFNFYDILDFAQEDWV